MSRFTPVHGGGRYSYDRRGGPTYGGRYGDYGYGDDYGRYGYGGDYSRYGYGGYSGYGYGGDYGYGGYGGYGDYGGDYPRDAYFHGYGGRGAAGGLSFYDDMAIDYRRGRRGHTEMPGTVIIEREPEFVCDDEKLVGGSRARLPQRMLRCASAGSLIERPEPAIQWQRQVQVDRCNLPWKRDANQCDAPAPAPKPFQRKVGWQQFEESMVKSFENALKRQEQPPPRDDKVVVMQGQPPAGQQTTVIQQQKPKTQKYTVTVLNPGGAQQGYAQPGYAQRPVIATGGYPARPGAATGGYLQPTVVQNRPQIVSTQQAPLISSQRQVVRPMQSTMVLGQPQINSQILPAAGPQPTIRSQMPLLPQAMIASQQRLVSQPAASQVLLAPTGTANRLGTTSRIVTRT